MEARRNCPPCPKMIYSKYLQAYSEIKSEPLIKGQKPAGVLVLSLSELLNQETYSQQPPCFSEFGRVAKLTLCMRS